MPEGALPPELCAVRASFVTLRLGGRLRGCIGMLEACRPLAEDVAENAFAAAFRDPRFPAVDPREAPRLKIAISVLSPAEELRFGSEAELLAQIRPGIDGLILQEGVRRGTFLPSVWAELPHRVQFLRNLKEKAGLAPDHWSDAVRIFRYTADCFTE